MVYYAKVLYPTLCEAVWIHLSALQTIVVNKFIIPHINSNHTNHFNQSHQVLCDCLQKDLDLVDVDDGSDVEYLDIGEDLDTEPIKKDDIAEFIEQLGIKKQRPDTGLVCINMDVCHHFFA